MCGLSRAKIKRRQRGKDEWKGRVKRLESGGRVRSLREVVQGKMKSGEKEKLRRREVDR